MMFEHICQQNIFLVMSLSHLPNFSQNQFEDNEGCVDVLYMDSRTSRVLQLFDLHARCSEKFPSRFGGHLLSINIPLEKSGGILHLLLRSRRDVTTHRRPLIHPGALPYSFCLYR
jgi:hypothetical protein